MIVKSSHFSHIIFDFFEIQKRNYYQTIKGRADAEDKWEQENNATNQGEDGEDFFEGEEEEDDEDDEDEDEDDEDNNGNNYDTISKNCSDEEFECVKDLKCIPSEKYCDYVTDCADGSDEAKCPIPSPSDHAQHETSTTINPTEHTTDQYDNEIKGDQSKLWLWLI